MGILKEIYKGICKTLSNSLIVFCSVFSLSSLAHAGEVSEKKEFTFGIVPQQSATRLAKMWTPFLEKLSKEVGVKIKFATAKNIPTFEACLANGVYDLSYMNPYHFTTFNELNGYQAFARQTKKKLKGIIVVKKDSPYAKLTDLDGLDLAFPSPAAFGASVIPRAEMKKMKMSFTPKYVKSHDSVYRSVAAGFMQAGGGVLRTWGAIPEGLKSQLKIIYKTKGYTPHAFATHPRVSKQLVEKIKQAMKIIDNNHKGLVKSIGMKGFDLAKDSDWDDVRSLNLTKKHTKIITNDKLSCHSG